MKLKPEQLIINKTSIELQVLPNGILRHIKAAHAF